MSVASAAPTPGHDAAHRAGWRFASPALLLIALFFFLPVLAALVLSFTDFDLYALADPSTVRVVGFANYTTLLATPLFWKALGNTTLFVVLGVQIAALGLLGELIIFAHAGTTKDYKVDQVVQFPQRPADSDDVAAVPRSRSA